MHKFHGITIYQIKILAIVLMTADHIASYMFRLPIIQAVQELLHLLGRGAAPLFLYCVTESLRNSKSRFKYFSRMYCAAVFCGLFNIFASKSIELLFQATYSFSNILHSYVWLIYIVEIMERMQGCCRDKKWLKFVVCLFLLAVATCLSSLIDTVFLNYNLTCRLFNINFRCAQLLLMLKDAFTVSPFRLEYSMEFVLLGCGLYFAKSKIIQCSILTIYGIVLFF